ncbi:MAG: bacterial proteasome activator family protein [Angustibacter sp.]
MESMTSSTEGSGSAEHDGAEHDGAGGDVAGEQQGGRFVVVTQDGMGVAARPNPDADGEQADQGDERSPADLVEQPAKVMRIGSMVKQLLEEVRSAPLDDAGRARLADIHERSLHELEDGLAPELVEELRRIALPFGDGATPSDAELRIAQAQLVGWLEGLFHGIQTALVAQQMAARTQLEQMRRALPPGAGATAAGLPGSMPGHPGQPGEQQLPPQGGTGQYL